MQNGRPVVFYSREDLTAGMVGEPVDGVMGYTPETATEIARNVVLHAAYAGKPPATQPTSQPTAKPTAKPTATAPVAGVERGREARPALDVPPFFEGCPGAPRRASRAGEAIRMGKTRQHGGPRNMTKPKTLPRAAR